MKTHGFLPLGKWHPRSWGLPIIIFSSLHILIKVKFLTRSGNGIFAVLKCHLDVKNADICTFA